MFFNLTGIGQSEYTYQTSFPTETFWGYTLSSLDPNPIVYQFNMDLESSNIDVVGDFKLYQNYQKYPAYKFGNLKYKKGSLKTMPYTYSHYNNLYTTDVALLNDLISFINNKKEKILTFPNNDQIKICTMGASYKYMEGIVSQPYHINFQYIQIGNVA